MEYYIVYPDFSAAFDRVSHSGVLSKLKSIGIGSSVLSICREFLFNRRQRVVVDGVLHVSESKLFLVCYRYVGSSSIWSSFILVKRLSWWRTDYMPMLMTPHYWKLIASQQTDLLMLPSLTT